jgi:hypothetical protein
MRFNLSLTRSLRAGQLSVKCHMFKNKRRTITDSNGDLTTASIHDFLDGSNINLGISSNVEYVN